MMMKMMKLMMDIDENDEGEKSALCCANPLSWQQRAPLVVHAVHILAIVVVIVKGSAALHHRRHRLIDT